MITWIEEPAGDWKAMAGDTLIGKAVYQDLDGERAWYSVSTRFDHGPEAGSLNDCKRRIEALWDEAGDAAKKT